MTLTEIKAKEKEEELIQYFQDIVYLGVKDISIECAEKVCIETIEALNYTK